MSALAQPLSGQTILVTGATGVIGRAIVAAIRREGGKPLIHCSRDIDGARHLAGADGIALQADLADPAAAFALWDEAVARAGRIHALVNNAGIRTEIAATSEPADWQAAWEREFRINLFAAADLSRQAISHFRDHGGGRIINMASRAGQRGYAADALPYGASKAALINLTKSIARSFGADGVTAIAIAPGWVRTDMSEDYMARHGSAAVLGEIPTGAMAEPDALGELVAFALRPGQIGLNGATLDVNGGSYIR